MICDQQHLYLIILSICLFHLLYFWLIDLFDSDTSHENQTPGPTSSVKQLQSRLTDLLAFANTASPVLTEQTRKRTRILTPDESPAAMESDNLADLDIPQHTKQYIETAIAKELDLRIQPFLQLLQEQ